MTDKPAGRDYRETLFLPQTEFPMKAGLPKMEPAMLERWARLDLYKMMREEAAGREKYVLHDGPPYANGHLHIGHALNKILKDVVTRSMQMMGYDSNYVPGWDCHGLPIEWKIEEQYRAKGKDKDEVPVVDFRRECREFAEHWIDVQREEFKRLGVEGDWDNPYLTMAYEAEAHIAAELMKFATSGQLYRGSKPVMWSVVEKTALAEAEVEYADYESDTIWAKFPVASIGDDADPSLKDASILIWTTTPWTIPGNRAICFSPKVAYGLYEVTAAENEFGPQPGETFVVADALAAACAEKAKLEVKRLQGVPAAVLADPAFRCHHPLRGVGGGYEFAVPFLPGDHVNDEDGTGFVHTAPGHGREDFEAWMDAAPDLRTRGIDTDIPFTVDANGAFTEQAPGFTGARVINDKGKKGDANQAVITALIAANALFARGRLKHQYPHSWRSKKPVIFRNTPQWFVYMDDAIEGRQGDTLRVRALEAIDQTRFVPSAGQARLRGMIQDRPDWVLSRQRAWGVPIAVFANAEGEVLKDEAVNARIYEAFRNEGADAWFEEGASARFIGAEYDLEEWVKVDDILDVWFDSGSTHAFCLEQRPDLKWPASLYLEGSDQHRGWFHSSLLESCGTRGVAPYEAVLTHGFVMDEEGRKMSKSLGNVVTPQAVMDQNGADILRLWVMSSDYAEDLRIGQEIIKTNVDSYRKLRNTMRFLLGNLDGFSDAERVDVADLPELERYMLHRLTELDAIVRQGYHDFDYKRIFARLFNFCTVELSALYFDIRKDALYCDPASSHTRRACRTVLDEIFSCLTAWLAPMLAFTMEEVWLARNPSDTGSVHLRQFPDVPQAWRDEAVAAKWEKVRQVRRVVTGALEIERREKRIGSSLEAAPEVHISDEALLAALEGLDLAEISITSGATLNAGEGPEGAFRMEEVAGVAVVPAMAEGRKCARSWKVLADVGSDADYPELSARDAAAVREWDQIRAAAE
ncbi:MAG: isoleucine--tRNA ligase [Alphaproteobacteria bacterium]|nr:isoleucine--tRNA ligase [Alphaproteobacteria bacterium]